MEDGGGARADQERTDQERADQERERRRRALSALACAQLGVTGPPAIAAAGAPLAADTADAAQGGRRLLASILLVIVCLALLAGGLAYAHPWQATGAHSSAQPSSSSASAGDPFRQGGSCVRLGAHPRPPYANIRVSHDSAPDHSEPMVAENPANPLDLVGGSKFFSDPAHYVFKIGYYYSFDGGCTWSDGGVLPGYEDMFLTSDIAFAFGPGNRVYASVIYEGQGSESGLAVSTSEDGGRTFGPPVVIYDDPSGNVFSDKDWIGVDTSNSPYSGDVYVVWSYDHGGACGDGNDCSQELGFARSTNGGVSFSPPQQVEGSAPFCTDAATGRPAGSTLCDGVLGATPAIGPDGSLAIAYAYTDVMGDPIPTKMVVVASHDGGLTWDAPALAATIHDTPFSFAPDRFRNFSLPAFAADPTTGQLYLTWPDEQQGHAQIVLTTSRDHGRTWSVPVRVNDEPPGGANSFQPALAVAPDGVVSVSFFTTRNDPTGRLLDVYLAQSSDHGASFLPNERVTSRSIDPALGAPTDEYGNQFFGDYQGLAADNAFAHPFWNDSRTGAQEIFTTAMPSARPSARP